MIYIDSNKRFRVGIYLRLSCDDDNIDESQSICNQRDFIMNYVKKNDLTFVDEYIDDGVSGTGFDRKGFNRMLRDIDSNRINMVITKDSSRLGRNISQSLYYTTEYFQEKNVRYIALNDNIDTFDKNQNTDMLLFKSFYNEMYVKDISQKIKATLNSQKKNGKFMGGNPPYGYDRNLPYDKHELVINSEQADVVKMIFNLFIEGNSPKKIAEILTFNNILIPSIQKGLNRGLKSSLYGIWHESVIRSILTNPTYKGDLTQCREYKVSYKSKKRRKNKKNDWVSVKNSCPAIINEEIFDLVQNLYSKNRNLSKKSKNYLLRGFLFCGDCGHTISINRVSWTSGNALRVKNICNCNYYKKFSKYNVCTAHKFDYDHLEMLVISDIKEKCNSYLNINKLEFILSENNSVKKIQNDLEKQLIKNQNSIKEYKIYIDKIYKDRLSDFIDDEMFRRQYNIYNCNILNLKKEISIIEEKLKKIQQKIFNYDYRDVINQFLLFIRPSKKFLCSLIDKIEIYEENKIKIYYKFRI